MLCLYQVTLDRGEPAEEDPKLLLCGMVLENPYYAPQVFPRRAPEHEHYS